jgi:uncharacterized protein (DUF1697 family)
MISPDQPMTRYAAFLRAVNVGGRRVVKMQALERLFEAWGAAIVDTFIATGSVVFDTSRRSADVAERAIEDRLRKALGYPVMAFLRTLPELAAVAAHAVLPPSTAPQLARPARTMTGADATGAST